MYGEKIKNINLGIYIFDFTDSPRFLLSNIRYSQLLCSPIIRKPHICAAFFIVKHQMNSCSRFDVQTNLVHTEHNHKLIPHLVECLYWQHLVRVLR